MSVHASTAMCNIGRGGLRHCDIAAQAMPRACLLQVRPMVPSTRPQAAWWYYAITDDRTNASLAAPHRRSHASAKFYQSSRRRVWQCALAMRGAVLT